jgi:hypothetical protein
MPGPRSVRLVETVLRCYPARWRSRHGDEAAELATLLMRDGISARSIAWSYLMGAARERLTPKPSRRLGAVAGALLVAAGALGVPLAILSSSAPVRAATRPGEILPCSPLVGMTVKKALPALEALHVQIVWDLGAGQARSRSVPNGSYYVAGGNALSPSTFSVRVTVKEPASHNSAGRHGQRC